MDGENHGKPYEQMDDLGGCFPLFSEKTRIHIAVSKLQIVSVQKAVDKAVEFPQILAPRPGSNQLLALAGLSTPFVDFLGDFTPTHAGTCCENLFAPLL